MEDLTSTDGVQIWGIGGTISLFSSEKGRARWGEGDINKAFCIDLSTAGISIPFGNVAIPGRFVCQDSRRGGFVKIIVGFPFRRETCFFFAFRGCGSPTILVFGIS